jgi:hypothetical protein
LFPTAQFNRHADLIPFSVISSLFHMYQRVKAVGKHSILDLWDMFRLIDDDALPAPGF